ncbi:unnamed protein product [Periconia digitata]|uniref:Alpha/beta hydrolase fold-3 domain-containing protein n=1 Tax=Periconia digitata TaxID=1303443 RepID=A0A9W4XQM3_9PLEO|nr:unnamed protein product [Periconia digitata]
MEASPTAILKLLLPKTPFILKTALAHTLSLSPTASKWDLRTELTINIMRSMLVPGSTPSTISKNQRLTTKDPGVKGKMWISKVSIPVDSDDDHVRQLVLDTVDSMSTTPEQKATVYEKPASQPLEAEWTGYRASATSTSPEPPNLSEQEKYNNLVAETTSKVTTLYFHGGAMYLLDPSTYRNLTSRIAKDTGGRVFSVRYRLAPQHPFPAALLDALVAYIGLLHPPPGSPHAPIPASEIVFAGDSAGGMLCAALLQLLLQIHRTHTPSDPSSPSLPTVKWHNKDVPLPLPAGLALTSPWLDLTRSLPSLTSLAHYDYLPSPSQTLTHRWPACPAWPSPPPRADLYCDGGLLLHPLASPLMALDWTNAPPVFFSVGQEMLRDEDAVLARRLVQQGSVIRWVEFEGMPHVFAVILEGSAAADRHHEVFAAFCSDVVVAAAAAANKTEGQGLKSEARLVLAKSLKDKDMDLKDITDLTDEQVDGLCNDGMKRIVEVFEARRNGDEDAVQRAML